jgi:hypothetical protein
VLPSPQHTSTLTAWHATLAQKHDCITDKQLTLQSTSKSVNIPALTLQGPNTTGWQCQSTSHTPHAFMATDRNCNLITTSSISHVRSEDHMPQPQSAVLHLCATSMGHIHVSVCSYMYLCGAQQSDAPTAQAARAHVMPRDRMNILKRAQAQQLKARRSTAQAGRVTTACTITLGWKSTSSAQHSTGEHKLSAARSSTGRQGHQGTHNHPKLEEHKLSAAQHSTGRRHLWYMTCMYTCTLTCWSST